MLVINLYRVTPHVASPSLRKCFIVLLVEHSVSLCFIVSRVSSLHIVGVVPLTQRVHVWAFCGLSLSLVGYLNHCRLSDTVLGNMFVLSVERKVECNTTSRYAKIANGSAMTRLLAYEMEKCGWSCTSGREKHLTFLGTYGAGGQTVIHMKIYEYKNTPRTLKPMCLMISTGLNLTGWIMKSEKVFGSSALQSSHG